MSLEEPLFKGGHLNSSDTQHTSTNEKVIIRKDEIKVGTYTVHVYGNKFFDSSLKADNVTLSQNFSVVATGDIENKYIEFAESTDAPCADADPNRPGYCLCNEDEIGPKNEPTTEPTSKPTHAPTDGPTRDKTDSPTPAQTTDVPNPSSDQDGGHSKKPSKKTVLLITAIVTGAMALGSIIAVVVLCVWMKPSLQNAQLLQSEKVSSTEPLKTPLLF